jgi:hypothetical protein
MRIAFVAALAALAFVATTPVWAHVVEKTVQLTVDEEVPPPTVPSEPTPSGTAELEVNEELAIEYNVTVQNLTGAAAAAHIHLGAPGVPGDIVFTLAKVNDTTFTGETEPLTEAQLQTLMEGGFYVNVHTVANLAGEIRGQITDLEIVHGTCSCRTLSKKAFRKCVKGEIKKLEPADRKAPEVKALKKAVKKSACGLTAQPKKKPLACCLPINEAANTAVSGKLCAPVKKESQCAALGGTIVADATCVPDNPCVPPASPSGAFVD